jgi:predicted dehydrogenase
LRNWYYYTWLSGDHIVEQHVHNHDKAAWVFKGEMPVAASGMGGRQVRTDPKFGNIFDHHSVVYEYANGRRLFSFCRQSKGCPTDVHDYVFGTRGQAELMDHTITGSSTWAYQGKAPNMYKQEHVEIWNALRAGTPINDGESAANSSMMAILGRMCTYSGQQITWADALASKLSLAPKAYGWGPAPEVHVAIPGKTKVL